jgi:hypothetical protein
MVVFMADMFFYYSHTDVGSCVLLLITGIYKIIINKFTALIVIAYLNKKGVIIKYYDRN